MERICALSYNSGVYPLQVADDLVLDSVINYKVTRKQTLYQNHRHHKNIKINLNHKNKKFRSFKSKEHNQKENGPDCTVSDNQSSSVTLYN